MKSVLSEWIIDEDSLLFDIASQLNEEGYMTVRFRDDILHSIRITLAGEGICRLLEGKGGTQ